VNNKTLQITWHKSLGMCSVFDFVERDLFTLFVTIETFFADGAISVHP
jgi:hypothetical protein